LPISRKILAACNPKPLPYAACLAGFSFLPWEYFHSTIA
jgi:hypothetical protein